MDLTRNPVEARTSAHDPMAKAEARLDGRNVDPEIGALSGEGSAQLAREPLAQPRQRPYADVAADAAEREEGTSYYGLPVLCEPVWKWMIPAYFFVGGLAGASAVLGGAAQARGIPCPDLIRRCRAISMVGSVASAALLIADLGRPARFLNMLRVFRPTSPMNMGTWILTGFGVCSGASLLPEILGADWRRAGRRALRGARALAGRGAPGGRMLRGRRAFFADGLGGALSRTRARRGPAWLAATSDVAGYGAAALGLPLVGYTGVLLANTAVPVWQQTRNTLPVLFAFSGAVSAGALFDVWQPRRGAELAHRFGLLARGAEVAASVALDREAAAVPRVARPLRHGASGAILNAARAMLVGSLLAELAPVPPGVKRLTAGALALAGTLALRFGIVQAGHASARDPHATFAMQRAGHGAAGVRGKRAGRMPSLPGVEPTGEESVLRGAGPHGPAPRDAEL